MKAELILAGEGGKELYFPPVEEGIEWSTDRRGTPGKLTFKVLADPSADFSEGSAVQFRVDGKNVFFGFVFTQKRDKENRVTVTAYDQLRYMKNKDTCVYEEKTASQLLQMLAADFALNTGKIADTGYVIASRVEDNTTLFDMIENALDLTLVNTGNLFVLYDDFGQLTLKNISDMYVKDDGSGSYLMIDEETGENFEYSSSIDSGTYNTVKLIRESETEGKWQVYIARDGENRNRWGVLQYCDTLSEKENGEAKADALLKLYNKKTRNLRITGAFGNVNVRGGSIVVVNLDLGDTKVRNFMMVEKVRHIFKNGEHLMDLTLRGGDFVV